MMLAFEFKNRGRGLEELDLHLLLVDEAMSYIEERLQQTKESNLVEFIVVHGQGNHSEKNLPKIKPACYKILDEKHVNYIKDTPNEGCLTVKLS